MKSGRIFVISAVIVAAQVAFASGPAVPQPPPIPPIIQPYPGPIGPDGPVDPTPTQPPPSAS